MNDIIAQITLAAVFIAVGYVIGLLKSGTKVERYKKRAKMFSKFIATNREIRRARYKKI